MSDPAIEAVGRSPPRTHVDNQPLLTDSMVTVNLSESGYVENVEEGADQTRSTPLAKPAITVDTSMSSSRPNSIEILDSFGKEGNPVDSPKTMEIGSVPEMDITRDASPGESQRSRSNSASSRASAQVDWDQLQKSEAQEQRDDVTDESTALLLARLEQENNAIATDPKSGMKTRNRAMSRPPSLQQIKKLVEERGTLGNVRFSLLPSPPPMTELEFWIAIVQDYPQTAMRLPTLTSNKIRGGVPAPLRGQVWISVAGARDRALDEQFDKLCGETSPYENLIGKDIGRSFPGVEMFRDPQGEGQKSLARVLKCFSLYDPKIGYCQGLGFLVGPLLMQMGDKEAFCLLVRLMDDYDLRSCFLPDLRGLHLRIFQFQKLLRQHFPKLAAHLDSLQVDAAYLSQWFLSFFAVTCPLPMLFRIYDVIFAEGASETIMRVALSIMKRNEERLLAFTEFEDAMQLLLSRALWDPYGRNAKSADEMVNDFTSFTGVVTRESLQNLEASFKDAQNDESSAKTGILPDVQGAASRFLGRLWAPSTTTMKTQSLSPGLSAPSRPASMLLRRSPSKQSLASTLNSVEVTGSDSTTSLASTGITEVSEPSRESSADVMSIKSRTESVRVPAVNNDKDLHGQIEDLLTALVEMQKRMGNMEMQLQKEREEHAEDLDLFRPVLEKFKQQGLLEGLNSRTRNTAPASSSLTEPPSPFKSVEFLKLVEAASTRFSPTRKRESSAHETKASLRESLDHTKALLKEEQSRSASLAEQLSTAQTEATAAKEHLREARQRLQDNHRERQRLEKTVYDLRTNARKQSITWSEGSSGGTDVPSLSRSDTAESTTSNGLRELKLGRSASVKSQRSMKGSSPESQHAPPLPQPSHSNHGHQQSFSKRTSSLATQSVLATENHAPAGEDALLLELVNAKTAEALARQELEEMRGRFESMRKMLGIQTPSPGHKTSPSEGGSVSASSGVGGYIGLNFGSSTSTPRAPTDASSSKNTAASATATTTTGGFWGWGKRTVSSSTVTPDEPK
ncbi:rab-GTPase-TBC domain-containing protein [Lineolata rhizophorae]|uniref:Rab-GTPase-TBC domain-containing protein n=1 Tax=Lineolata rhizophorae TaxID=578093 RepID=A0A6A6P464_9PEZI|nr:rab-GTPase-TBC domain-containing protein [Lineolata rhizophorae]